MTCIVIKTPDIVTIHISNSKTDAVAFERRFPQIMTIEEFKQKLEIVTGGAASTMELVLYNGDTVVCKLDDDAAKLGSYPIDDGMRVHVIDQFLLVDAENVEKFELTDNQYAEKQDTVRSFLQKNRLGKYDEAEMKRLEAKKQQAKEKEEQMAKQIQVGLRCKVTTNEQPTRLGTVMFNGRLEGKKNLMIGVKFDEPLGVNDGRWVAGDWMEMGRREIILCFSKIFICSVNGVRYFECGPKYGSFIVPSAVTVGDFPEENDGLEDDEI